MVLREIAYIVIRRIAREFEVSTYLSIGCLAQDYRNFHFAMTCVNTVTWIERPRFEIRVT